MIHPRKYFFDFLYSWISFKLCVYFNKINVLQEQQMINWQSNKSFCGIEFRIYYRCLVYRFFSFHTVKCLSFFILLHGTLHSLLPFCLLCLWFASAFLCVRFSNRLFCFDNFIDCCCHSQRYVMLSCYYGKNDLYFFNSFCISCFCNILIWIYSISMNKVKIKYSTKQQNRDAVNVNLAVLSNWIHILLSQLLKFSKVCHNSWQWDYFLLIAVVSSIEHNTRVWFYDIAYNKLC